MFVDRVLLILLSALGAGSLNMRFMFIMMQNRMLVNRMQRRERNRDEELKIKVTRKGLTRVSV